MSKPLEGFRVLELCNVLAGPSACLLLADLGADVIKVEQPGTGDLSRNYGPFYKGSESVYFMCVNRNKRSIALDLKSAKGKEIFHRLAKTSDVILEAYRPGVTQRLGVDYETISKINPRIVYCSLSGFGQEGPDKHRPAFDPVIQAISGMMSFLGEKGGPPLLNAIPLADVSSGHIALVGIQSALLQRERTGKGAYMEIAMMDVMLFMFTYLSQFCLSEGFVADPVGNCHPTNIPVKGCKTKDGKYIEIYAAPQRFFENFTKAIAENVPGFEGFPADARFADSTKRFFNKEALYELMDKAFITKTAAGWMEILDKADVPYGLVSTIDEAFKNPTINARNMVVEIDHPKAGKFKTFGNPIKIAQMKEEYKPSPALGGNASEILTELGYSAEEVKKLKQEKVI